MSISHCPAEATSWCCISTSMPQASICSDISLRRSSSVSAGATGKYPSFERIRLPIPGWPVFQIASGESML